MMYIYDIKLEKLTTEALSMCQYPNNLNCGSSSSKGATRIWVGGGRSSSSSPGLPNLE